MATHPPTADPTVFSTQDERRHHEGHFTALPNSSIPSPRVALITGAGQGIGRAIALRLARDGYHTALDDMPSNKTALEETAELVRKRHSRNAITIYIDVSKEDQVGEMIDRTVRELGGLDVMVANAGVALLEPFIDSSMSVWEKTMNVNVFGIMLCYKHAARAMIAQGRGGRLIAACSIAGKRGDPDSAAYCASKFAVRGLSQSAAIELAPHGINVNCYAPGAIHTNLLDEVDKKYTAEEGEPVGSYIKKRAEGIPAGRVGTPEDVAGVVSWLASEDSKFVTGQAITVDGGTLFD
ncbi:NAD(P)-binding protein [Obba rivulosa]|uniref:NAD(P)-binding protein n=1 Tax=Obba rivulosa TaxID=1052685 RepID=A0A8E2DL76_9APHY|nr:NAD(P)-binding protein [Obba rivulosa]